MKFKLFLKRFLAWIGAAAMLLAVVGCAKAPDASVIAKTNTEQIITLASAEGDSAVSGGKESLAARIGAPERLTWENTSADGKLTVSMDAPVWVPENDMPVVRVEPVNFSQETIDQVYRGLVGDTPMYETVYQRTKLELENLLAYYRGVLEDASVSAVDKDFAQDYIKDFEAQLADAPESIAPVLGTSELKRIPVMVEGNKPIYYDKVDLMSEDRKAFFSVNNDLDNTEPVSTVDVDENGNVTGGSTIMVMRNASISYCVMNDGFPHQGNDHDMRWIDRNDPLPTYTDGLIQMTPAQAALKAEDILMRMGVADIFGIYKIYLRSDYRPDWDVPQATGYYYTIECTRRIGNIPLADSYGSGTRARTYWGTEGITIEIGDCGVELVSWTAPMNILEIVNAAAQIRPYFEIEEIAKKILPMKYESEARDDTAQSVVIKIDRVTLTLQRIVEPNQPFAGLLIPVWNFYGTKTITRNKGDGQNSSDFKVGSFLSINAIDGNIINVEKGY